MPVRRTGVADFWGYMQEDQFVGDLRAFLDERVLQAHDTLSPLLPPLYHAGPWMVYRNSPAVNGLFRHSADWRQVATNGEYLAFDEWWGGKLTDHMPAVVAREHRAGRLRAYCAAPQSDGKLWLVDDFFYSGSTCKAQSGADVPACPIDEESRWYDESFVYTWRRGRLWAGTGSDSTTSLWDGAQRQVATAPLGSPLLAASMHGMLAGSSAGTLVRECLRLAAHGRRWQCCT